jgi:hypothetical protein
VAEEAKSVIVLTAGESLESPDPVRTLHTRLHSAIHDPDITTIRVIDTQGREHWINVEEIVQIYEPGK